jgi:uncharacterized phage protein (TIGR02218 family)
MPRTISVALKAHLQGEVQTLAFCAKLTRRDGSVQGFTSADMTLEVDGVFYEECDTVMASGIRSSEGTGVDNLDIFGLIDAESITDVNIRAGRYDGAEVEIFVVNYEDLTQGQLILVSGTFGELAMRDGEWIAEVRALMQRIAQQLGELTSLQCRVKELGDARCKFVLVVGTHINARTVFSVTSTIVVTFDADTNVSGFYNYGTVEMTSGDNAGLVRTIKSHLLVTGRAQLTLAEPFPFAILAGETGVLTKGCDRRFATCIADFNNALNFRGEPHIPGTDQIMKRGRKA